MDSFIKSEIIDFLKNNEWELVDETKKINKTSNELIHVVSWGKTTLEKDYWRIDIVYSENGKHRLVVNKYFGSELAFQEMYSLRNIKSTLRGYGLIKLREITHVDKDGHVVTDKKGELWFIVKNIGTHIKAYKVKVIDGHWYIDDTVKPEVIPSSLVTYGRFTI